MIMLSPESRAEVEQALAAAGALYDKATESANFAANIVALTRAIAASRNVWRVAVSPRTVSALLGQDVGRRPLRVVVFLGET